MKQEIHPVYPPSRIVCACGNTIETRSTRGSFHVEICSNCHPFFTGKYKLVDTAGRVERFRNKWGAKAGMGKAAEGGEAKAKPAAATAAPKGEKKAEGAKGKKAEKKAAAGKDAAAPAEKDDKPPEA